MPREIGDRILETMEGKKEIRVTVIGSFRDAGIKPRQRRQSVPGRRKKKEEEESKRSKKKSE